MQEINHARQESSARSSEPRERRCPVCDGLVERPYLTCRECWYRDMEEQEWESYLEFVSSDDAVRGNPEPRVEDLYRRSSCHACV